MKVYISMDQSVDIGRVKGREDWKEWERVKSEDTAEY